MLAAFLGGAIAGVPGALVATPLVGTVKQLYLEFRFGGAPPNASQGLGLLRRARRLLRIGPEFRPPREPTESIRIDPILHGSVDGDEPLDDADGDRPEA